MGEKNMIKAIIFDLDGVIVSTDGLHYLAWKYVADQEHIYFDESINNRLRGVSRMESLDIILERSNREYSELEKINLARQKNDYYVDLLSSLSPVNILDGVHEVITLIKRKGIPAAIGSSSKNAKRILSQIGLVDAFDVIVDGNDISRSKPDPEVFLLAAKRLNIDPKHCLVVEDAIAGIQAAVTAGMMTFAVGDAQRSAQATYRGEAVSDIITLF
jgi:beta-phosphoglucomutase